MILLKPNFKTLGVVFIFMNFVLLVHNARAQAPDSSSSTSLKKLSIEELMNIQVTSVSRMPEKLAEVASAIQVLTRDDIRRSAATSLPEALRLLPNLQVTQLNSHHWNISARGFNAAFSNKLLVMIDGRTVYSPLFAGVFWDAQSVILEDVDRIEVVSGPGGSLWGANAVNGVINIITKNARDTQGLFLSAAAGSLLKNQIEARYGATIGSKFSYRFYAQHTDRDPTLLANGTDNVDKWALSQGGFRMNWEPNVADAVSFQGNFYIGSEQGSATEIDGQNVMGKWKHTFSENSEITLQAYFDRTWRIDIPSTFDEQLNTYDIDLQHHFTIGKHHNILWGMGYRIMKDETWNSTVIVGLLPKDRNMNLFNSFIQDEISLMPDRLKLTIGTKLQHHFFSGLELMPSARIAWTPTSNQTIWSAVSRALRAPSRIDVDYFLPTYPVPANSPHVAGGPNFVSEKVISYELGYRIQPSTNLSFSIATFYNQYNDLYSVEALPNTLTFQIQNGVEGNAHGAELSGNYQPIPALQLRGGYTYFKKNLKNSPGNLSAPSALETLGMDAKNQFVMQSFIDLPLNLNLDLTYRYVDNLPANSSTSAVGSYHILDTHFSWQFKKHITLSLAGQNLLQKQHVEIGNKQISRNIYAKIVWRH